MITHEQKIEEAQQEIMNKRAEVLQHQWRLHYHVMPQANWMNDPNGFCLFNGEYHLFYQHHPFTPEWGPMYWGHVKSKDLVYWEHQPIALAPSEDYDVDGCFSGSAIEVDGKLYLMYTGNRWTGENQEVDLKQVQCLAVSEDGLHFTKLEQNPVISEAPAGDIHPFHFRDPKVWKEAEHYYCVLGSQTRERVGQVLLYRSVDLISWEFVNIMAKGEGNMGYMWECPDVFTLGDKNCMVMSPQGVVPEGEKYLNLHQAAFLLGDLDLEKGTLAYQEMELLDYGFDFYAPQTTVDKQGRRVLVAWMTMWESEMPEQEFNWAGAMSLPRVLNLQNGQLIQQPLPELESLRYDHVQYANEPLQNNTSFKGVSGNCLELKVVFDAKEATTFGLKVHLDKELGEETVFTYLVDEQAFCLNREKSGSGPGGIRKVPLALRDGKLELQLFLDKSSVEVFLQNGEKVMTARIYPNKNSKAIEFFSDEVIELVELNKWSLRESIN
ncbi:glycoside hydrolase family 32 protein [Alkalihalobacillus sp. 1P02AB]|uniref:glycoside hydrolase family 32 protein n=1 Tax=Alkalihalobacillus sp. 1P02AB TaxID=3132260 RepID=UPI0039A704C2